MRITILKSSIGRLHELHVGGHKLGNKGLEMVDGLVSFVQPVLIKRRELAEFSFQFSVTILGQLFLKSDKDDLERRTQWRLLTET